MVKKLSYMELRDKFPEAWIFEGVQAREDVNLIGNPTIENDVQIYDRVTINSGAFICSYCIIHSNCKIPENAYYHNGAEIYSGDEGMVIMTGKNKYTCYYDSNTNDAYITVNREVFKYSELFTIFNHYPEMLRSRGINLPELRIMFKPLQNYIVTKYGYKTEFLLKTDSNSMKHKITRDTNIIIEVLRNYIDIRPSEIFQRTRKEPIIFYRHLIYYFLYDMGYEYSDIAFKFQYERTTIYHGIKKLSSIQSLRPEELRLLKKVEKELK